jgi:hypothetical protein
MLLYLAAIKFIGRTIPLLGGLLGGLGLGEGYLITKKMSLQFGETFFLGGSYILDFS